MTRGMPSPDRSPAAADKLQYRFWDKLRDRRYGRRDGRDQIPKHDADDLRTPYWRRLDTHALELYDSEEKVQLESVMPRLSRYPKAQVELEQTNDKLHALEPMLTEATARYVEARDKADQLENSSGGLHRNLGPAIRAAHELRAEQQSLVRQVFELREKRDLLKRELVELEALLPPLMENLNKRLARIYHHVATRQNRYAHALLHRHPYRGQFEDRFMRLTPPQPPRRYSAKADENGHLQIDGPGNNNNQEGSRG